jgi:hypothetical protein
LNTDLLKVAASYLLVLHTLDELDESHEDVIRLLQKAVDAKEWTLCRDILRFLQSADESGSALRKAISMTDLLSSSFVSSS